MALFFCYNIHRVKLHQKIVSHLGRKVTVLIIPHTELKPWRIQFTAAFLCFCALIWSGMTIWAGYIAGRHVDYWVTKADNKVMMAKVAYLASEMDKSRDMLDMVRSTDKQLRSLLVMQSRHDIVDTESIGGPTAGDRLDLRRMLTGRAADIRQTELHRRIAAIRQETYKRLASFQEISWYIGNQRSLYQATPNMWPTAGQITSLFGYRFAPMQRVDGETGEFHQGIDIANNPDTLIYATADGTVRLAGWSHGYGQMVLIDHGYGFSTLFGHTSKSLVKTGDRVTRGQVIAYMGTTGRSTGAHLHYEVWKNARPLNPMTFLKVRAGNDLLVTQADTLGTRAGR